MRRILAIVILAVVVNLLAAGPSVACSNPSANIVLHITHGPIVEHVSETWAVIAWSTNINAGTVLRYGIDPDRLDQTAGMPWGGLTHRVEIEDLKPATKYFYLAESPQGQGTGETAQSPILSFQTNPIEPEQR